MAEKIVVVDNTIEEITVQEFTGAPTGTIITSTHGMDKGDQHTIRDIVGLKEKLDNIESLKPVRSNLGGHADYYQWGEEATEDNPLAPGYFVRLGADGYIYKCEGEEIEVQTTLPLETKQVIADESETWSEVNKITTYIYYIDATKTYYNYEVNAWVGYTEEEYKQIALDKIIMKYAYAGEIQTKDISKYYVVGTHNNETKQWIEPFDIYAYNGIEYVKKPSYSYKDGQVYKNALMDVFGVTIPSAGFVGNDENIIGTYTSAKATDVNYALVATTGVVDVICDHEVVAGDYVYPYACGCAKKSTGSYGYLVTALIPGENNILYARIVLTPSVVLAKEVSNNVDSLLETTRRLDKNITTFGNTAEAALKRAEELTEAAQQSANESQQIAQDATNAAVNAQNSANKAWGVTEQAQQAAKDAQAAQEAALTLKDEAIAGANEVAAQIATDKSNETLNTVRALEYRLDEYTVGQYSQAYGLTFAQAKAILPIGTTFIPMDEDPTATDARQEYEEVYANEETDVKQVFTVGYAYVWTNNGWLVDKTVLITRTPTEQTEGDYWFVTKEYDGEEYKCGSLYRWEDGTWEEVAIRKENVMNRTMAYLHHEDDVIRQSVTSVEGKVAAVETKVTETDARVGLVASVPTELVGVKPGNWQKDDDGTETFISIATFDDLNVDTYKETAKSILTNQLSPYYINGCVYYCVGKSSPYTVYKAILSDDSVEFVDTEGTITYDGVNFYKVNIASIFTTANEEGSSIRLNADKLNFSGVAAFVCDDNGGITEINGGAITTGVIQSADGNVKIDLKSGAVDIASEHVNITGRVVATSGEIGGCAIKEGNLIVPATCITGQLTADQIEAVEIDADKIRVDKLSSLSANLGDIESGSIHSPDYVANNKVPVIWDFDEHHEEGEDAGVSEDTEGVIIPETTRTPSEGLAYELNSDNISYTVKQGDCTDAEIVIPAEYDGKPITSIADQGFQLCNLTSIIIPDSVTSIGNYAFYGCSGLTSIEIPNGVTSIGDSAFIGCYKLVEVINKSSHITVSKASYSNGYVGYYALSVSNCDNTYVSKLTKDNGYIIYTDGAEKILVGYNGTETDLVLPSYITKIYQYAFYRCSSLTSVVIGDSVTSIGSYAFRGCDGLTSIVIPESVTSIGQHAFDGCSSLTSVFYKGTASNWGNISIDSNNETLTNAMRYYYSEDEPELNGDKTEYISNNYWCYDYQNIPVVWKYTGGSVGLTYQGYDNDNQVSYSVTGRGTCNDAEIIIPTTHLGYPVTRIEDNAFSGDTKLTKIVIPDFVTSIGSSAFSGCSDSIYNTKDGLKYLGNKEYLYLYLIGVTSTDITTTNIDSGCKIIGDLAFYGCANLASVSIPQGVTSIGYGAFAQCKQLTQVIIPNSVASIGNYAFDHCEGLSLVTIPNNLTKISDWAFQYCISLASVTIPNGVTSIGQKAFGYCASLTSIKIPNSVTYIGAGAFYECSGLMSMAIGNSVESIGDSTFLNCVSLTSIEIPDSVNYIGNSAFRGCSGLTSVVIPNGITSIGKYVFAECTKLGDIDIPDSVTEIGEAAFWGCSVLKSVILGRNIKTITAAAFNDTALTKVYYKNTQDNWGEVSAQGIPSGCTIYYYSEAEPLLSEDGTAYNGDYWMYQEQKGFQISCEGDYLIDSPHFKVTHEGDITAINGKFIGEIQAGDGNIGDLQISDEGLLSSSGSVQLSKDGLILCSDQPKIRVGDFTIGQNESGVTEFTASGPLVIQGMDNAGNTATSLTFMQSTDNESELNVEVAVKVECCDTSNDRPKIRAWLETYNGVKPYYAISVTLSYQWARGYTGVFGPYDVVLTLQANQTVGYSQYIEFDGNSLETERVSFMVKQGDYTWVWSDRYVVQELERMTLFTISKTQSPLSNQIGVYGHLIPQIGATDTEGFSLGAPLKYWHTIYAKTSEIDLSDMNEKNTINALSDQYSLVFDALTPVSYKFNTSTSDRLHTGFIAQDVKAAIENAGLTTQDFAAYCEWETNGETTCGLRYSEFIALCVNEIQKLKKRVAELENQTKGENNGTETTSDHS